MNIVECVSCDGRSDLTFTVNGGTIRFLCENHRCSHCSEQIPDDRFIYEDPRGKTSGTPVCRECYNGEVCQHCDEMPAGSLLWYEEDARLICELCYDHKTDGRCAELGDRCRGEAELCMEAINAN